MEHWLQSWIYPASGGVTVMAEGNDANGVHAAPMLLSGTELFSTWAAQMKVVGPSLIRVSVPGKRSRQYRFGVDHSLGRSGQYPRNARQLKLISSPIRPELAIMTFDPNHHRRSLPSRLRRRPLRPNPRPRLPPLDPRNAPLRRHPTPRRPNAPRRGVDPAYPERSLDSR